MSDKKKAICKKCGGEMRSEHGLNGWFAKCYTCSVPFNELPEDERVKVVRQRRVDIGLSAEPDKYGGDYFAYAKLKGKADAMQRDLDNMRELIDYLPKTADGVHVAPGMDVWVTSSNTAKVCYQDEEPYYITNVSAPDGKRGIRPVEVSECYASQHEARLNLGG